jgi:pimeloyl-ACP methyl ester carboxylesterase
MNDAQDPRAGNYAYVEVNGIKLCYELSGKAPQRILLIAGLGAQLTDWDDDFVDQLVASGFEVVRFDNRDSGGSTHIGVDVPDALTIWSGKASAPYSIADMAHDVAGLIETLEPKPTIALGQSLGAMVAQELAIRHRNLVAGLILISGTTGAREVGQATAQVQAKLATKTQPKDETPTDSAIASAFSWASKELGVTESEVSDRIKRRTNTQADVKGSQRQLAAALGSRDRTLDLQTIRVPTHVIHGEDDPLINCDGSVATAHAIAGAELTLIPKMRHDFPRQVWPEVIGAAVRVSRGLGNDIGDL